MAWWRNIVAGAPARATTTEIDESFWDAPYDPDAEHSAANLGAHYTRRLTSRTTRDLPQITFDTSLRMAHWLSVRNPLAKTILRLTRDFVIGDGFTVQATDADGEENEDVQAIVDVFWHDSRNRMDFRLPRQVRELGLFGEQHTTVFVNPRDGFVRLGFIDPADVFDIICDPIDNVENPVAIEMRQMFGAARPRYKIVREIEDIRDPWYGRLMGVKTRVTYTSDDRHGNAQREHVEVLDTFKDAHGNDVPYAGAVFFFKVNDVSNQKRGMTDLMDIIDWVDAYDQILFNDVDRAQLMKALVFDLKVTGDETAVNRVKREHGTAPKPGSVFVHNDQIELNAVTPNMQSHDTQTVSDLVLSLVATGASFPKTWLNGTMDVNRATASELSVPALRFLTERQSYVKYMVEQYITFALDQAEMAHKLPKRKLDSASGRPESWPFTVSVPELASRDLAPLADVLGKLVSALSTAKADGVIDDRLYQDLFAFVTDWIGYEIDLDELRDRLEEQKAEEEAEKEKEQAMAPEPTDDELAQMDEEGKQLAAPPPPPNQPPPNRQPPALAAANARANGRTNQ